MKIVKIVQMIVGHAPFAATMDVMGVKIVAVAQEIVEPALGVETEPVMN